MPHPIRHLLNALTGKRRRAVSGRKLSRSGSVLILVVALLVLMALIGTAWISTARTDRFATQQHAANTEIEMLIDGVVNMVKAALADDLFGPPAAPGGSARYRPPAVTPLPQTERDYEHFDIARPLTTTTPAISTDRYLAERTPTRIPAPSGPAAWAVMSGPITGMTHFDDVRDPATLPRQVGNYTNRTNMAATFVTINGKEYPALMDIVGISPDNINRRGLIFLAGDADGDGIADCGLVKLPIGQINGVTYYVGVRIVDNNSAVNVNTAFSRDNDFDVRGNRLAAGDFYRSHTFFPTRVGLAEMLTTYPKNGGNRRIALGEEFNNLQRLWWGDVVNFAQWGKPTQLYPTGITGGAAQPMSERPTMSRNDFRFISAGDAMAAMLGSRARNPGYLIGGANPRKYQAASPSEGGALAYAGGAVLPGDAAPTRLDLALMESIYRKPGLAKATPSMASSRYEPDQANVPGGWFDTIYDYVTKPDGPHVIRPLLVTTNAVSNATPFHAMPDALDPITNIKAMPPNVVKTPLPPPKDQPNQPTRAEIALLTPHLYPHLMSDNRVPGPNGTLVEAPTNKASVNTAEFNELWRAFWMVMATPTGDAPVQGESFRNPLRDPYNPTAGPGNQTAASGAPARILSTRDTMFLRAALAAVNTMDLRDSDDDVTSMPVTLPESGISAVVYGTERQPFITEVYVNTDTTTVFPPGTAANPRGYVAVELYNPYNQPVSLANWTLQIIDRRHDRDAPGGSPPSAYPNIRMIPLTRFTFGFGGAGVAPIVPANGRVVLENFLETAIGPPPAPGQPPAAPAAPGAGPYTSDPTQDAQSRPNNVTIPAGVQKFFVPGLAEVIRSTAVPPAGPGGELVLLRPRQASGVFSTRFNSVRNVTEVEALVSSGGGPVDIGPRNMVPVDSFDFHGITIDEATGPSGVFRVAHYVRRNGDAPGDQWRFVYPGQWHARHLWPAGTALPYRQEGVTEVQYGPGIGIPSDPTPVPIVLGGPNSGAGLATYVNYFPAIQLNNANWAGPSKLTPGPANPTIGRQFPFGAFARNGDILQVPFIGAYRLMRPGPIAAGELYELNPVTADSARADDNDTWNKTGAVDTPSETWTVKTANQTDDPHEMLGRFCPIRASAGPTPNPPLPTTGTYSFYVWAEDLFDYLTVQSPESDQIPNVYTPDYNLPGTMDGIEPQPTSINNVDPTELPDVTWGRVGAGSAGRRVTALTGLPDVGAEKYTNKLIVFLMPNGAREWRRIQVLSFPNASPTQNRAVMTVDRAISVVPGQTPFKILSGTNERKLGVEGLVNINTAPLKVLEQLPWVVDPTSGKVVPDLNRRMAQQIVQQRASAPFRSLFDLNQIVVANNQTFQNAMGTMPPQPGIGEGDYSLDTVPSQLGSGAVTPPEPADFESRFLMLNRLSNLITTRSDTFTCYVLVQGWRGAGSANPELVVQRRRAFIADRSSVTPTNREVGVQFFYND